MAAPHLADDPDDADGPVLGSAELARAVFAPVERWGWEYVPPPVPADEPDEPHPSWEEPAELLVVLAERRRKLRELPWMATGVGAAAAGVWVLPSLGTVIVNGVLASGLLVVGMSVVAVRQLIAPNSLLDEARRQRDYAYDRYEYADREWQRRRALRDDEQRRREQAEQWFPLRPSTGTTRVDVFGGNGDGWASLITTVGGSVLRAGGSVMVVDFSEERVANGLVELSRAAGVPTSDLILARDPGEGTLLQGLTPAEVAQVVAGAVATMRTSPDATDLRIVDTDVLKTIVECLNAPITFARLAAALRIVRGHGYEGRTADLLDVAEAGRLTSRIDLIGSTERVANALLTLTYLTELLDADAPPDATLPADPVDPLTWSVPGLTVLTSEGPHPDRKDFLDRVLFQRILHALRTNPRRGGQDVVFVANADHMGLDSLEALSKQARRAGVRLVLLLEHLRGELTQLLGTGSATILMRMGNADEAEAAAKFVGRGHSFVETQVAEQVGSSVTEGTSETKGTQTSTSENQGTHLNKPRSARVWDWKAGSKGESFGTATSRTNSWSYTANYSTAVNEGITTTTSRVYEFTVEPTKFQELPDTAFVLVEISPDGRHVVLGDCNPGITLLPRVAIDPRRRDG
ncbi:hypothetical protein IOD16_18175 [Saccharothrix sp. 6-C]|uniref:hypothetical protein n=1 Tax=Saccharothrix sp. 6-C TaxID=2781735 RepID=UPI001917342F|nr:hypothetical protein [Saccharothrix sp. 6-C]QQQ80139.1 hypothetical protein IOD16_18175 [Saccharothrix sp. 6-C]